MSAEVRRDWQGRPLVIPPGGGDPVAYSRCTTFVSVLEDTFNLQKWAQRMVALGLADRPDLVLAAAAHRGDRRKLDDICKQASEAARSSAAATVGTAVHALAEQLDRGEELGPIPEAYRADINAYAETTAPFKHRLIEQFMVCDSLQIGGTPDRIVAFEGSNYVADIKTGDIQWGIGKISMQLAVYARSQAYDPATGDRVPLDVSLERAIIIHLPAGKGECSLRWVDIDAGWKAVRVAAAVRAWRKRRGLSWPVVAEAVSA